MVTREEFNRLLDAYVNAWGWAYVMKDKSVAEYRDALAQAAEARQTLQRAVFGDDAV